MNNETQTEPKTQPIQGSANPEPRQAENLSLDARFAEYADVISRAIGAHRQSFPYSQILRLADTLIGGKRIGMAVYKTDPNHPHAFYTMTFENGRFGMVDRGKVDPHMTWKIRESHIDEVIENPDMFIEHPARLDLSWLKNRLGLGVSS